MQTEYLQSFLFSRPYLKEAPRKYISASYLSQSPLNAYTYICIYVVHVL